MLVSCLGYCAPTVCHSQSNSGRMLHIHQKSQSGSISPNASPHVSQATQTNAIRPRSRQQPMLESVMPPSQMKLSVSALSTSSLHSFPTAIKSPSRPSTSQSQSPLSRKDIGQLFLGGCTPLAILTSDEISELLSGAEATQRQSASSSHMLRVSQSSTPSHAPSPDQMLGLSSSSSIPAVKSCEGSYRAPCHRMQLSPLAVVPRAGGGASASPLPNAADVSDIIKRAQSSTFRRNFTLRIGASIPTSGCSIRTQSTSGTRSPPSYSSIAFEGDDTALGELFELEAQCRQQLLEQAFRDRERLQFAISRRLHHSS